MSFDLMTCRFLYSVNDRVPWVVEARVGRGLTWTRVKFRGGNRAPVVPRGHLEPFATEWGTRTGGSTV